MITCDYCSKTENVTLSVSLETHTNCNITPRDNMSFTKIKVGDICNECLSSLGKIIVEILAKMKNDVITYQPKE